MKFLFDLFYKEIKYPLGRWHNCGLYFDNKYFLLKEQQKLERKLLIKFNIDPYLINKK